MKNFFLKTIWYLTIAFIIVINLIIILHEIYLFYHLPYIKEEPISFLINISKILGIAICMVSADYLSYVFLDYLKEEIEEGTE